jgi:hypothetical protein
MFLPIKRGRKWRWHIWVPHGWGRSKKRLLNPILNLIWQARLESVPGFKMTMTSLFHWCCCSCNTEVWTQSLTLAARQVHYHLSCMHRHASLWVGLALILLFKFLCS